MIRKSEQRFSEKIMCNQKPIAAKVVSPAAKAVEAAGNHIRAG
jgi:hypothetical protein